MGAGLRVIFKHSLPASALRLSVLLLGSGSRSVGSLSGMPCAAPCSHCHQASARRCEVKVAPAAAVYLASALPSDLQSPT